MFYAITHLTRFNYSEPISDAVMEVRKQPRSDHCQRCYHFELDLSPKAKVQSHRDYLGNMVHVFDIPGQHSQLGIKMETTVEVKAPAVLPESVPMDTWEVLDEALHEDRDVYDMLLPSYFAQPSGALRGLINELEISRDDDPMTLLRKLNTGIYDSFNYTQNVTKVDSPIEEAIEKKLGVCQDFAHIMIAICRQMGIPCRYVSGYLYHRTDYDRSSADATHAWVEAWLPEFGWIGFDPTNNLIQNEQHIRVAVGRDYRDVPPTKGVFRGETTSTLDVDVKVSLLDELPAEYVIHAPEIQMPHYELISQHQQQQQQQ